MIPLSVKIRTHAVSSCGPGAAYDDVPATMGFDGVKVSASAHGRGESSRPRGYQNARKKASNDHFLDEKTPGLSRECRFIKKLVDRIEDKVCLLCDACRKDFPVRITANPTRTRHGHTLMRVGCKWRHTLDMRERRRVGPAAAAASDRGSRRRLEGRDAFRCFAIGDVLRLFRLLLRSTGTARLRDDFSLAGDEFGRALQSTLRHRIKRDEKQSHAWRTHEE